MNAFIFTADNTLIFRWLARSLIDMLITRIFTSTLLLILCITPALATSTTYISRFSTFTNSIEQRPSYLLGNLIANTQVTIFVRLPDPQGYDLTPKHTTIRITDGRNFNMHPVHNFTQCSGSQCFLTWNVPANNAYHIQVFATDTQTDQTKIVMFQLTVTYSNIRILQVTDILRQRMIKYLYLASRGSLTLTLSPVANNALSYLILIPLVSGYTAGNSIVLNKPTSSASLSATYVTNIINPGYYAVKIISPSTTNQVSFTHTTSLYQCPHDPLFTDVYGIFQGCSHPGIFIQQQGLPCTNYDAYNRVCRSCLNGYKLTQGICVLAIPCKNRQYLSATGRCFAISPTCGNVYDPYSGQCLNCQQNFYLASGQCISVRSLCLEDAFYADGNCVSRLCGNYDPRSGLCTSCVNTAFFLRNGTCLIVECGAGKFWSVQRKVCMNVPTGCAQMNLISQLCQLCLTGFTKVQQNCISTSANCASYSTTINFCLLCLKGYDLTSGYCIKRVVICNENQIKIDETCVPKPKTPCASGQIQINGRCMNLPSNCLHMDAFSQCTQCQRNFQLQGTVCRRCAGINPSFPCVLCPSGFFIDPFGMCRQVSIHCLTSDTSGRCTSCKNGLNPVFGMCCPNGQIVQNGQCQSPNTSGGSGSSSQGGSSSSPSLGGSSSDRFGRFCGRANIAQGICLSCLGGRPLVRGRCD